MKPCDRGRGDSVLLIKAAVKVIQFIGKSIGSILLRRLIVGYNLYTLPYFLIESLVVRFFSSLCLTGIDGLFRCIPRFLVFAVVTVFFTHPVSPVACVYYKY